MHRYPADQAVGSICSDAEHYSRMIVNGCRALRGGPKPVMVVPREVASATSIFAFS